MGLKSITFEFTIGGYPGPSFHLEVHKDQLHCTHSLHMEGLPEKSIIELKNNKKWEAVISFLATRKWKGEYMDHRIVDGTGWELIVKTGTYSIQSSGSNVYPTGFWKFLKLLNVVTEETGITVY